MGKNTIDGLIPDDFETTITLSLDDDEELECAVLSIFEAEDNRYIALLPLDTQSKYFSEDVFLYRYNESEDGEPILTNIESDEEFEIASDAYDEILDEAEYQELLGDDEE